MPNKTITEINNLLDILQNSQEIAIDTETTGLDIISDEIIGISFAVKEKEAYYIALPNDFQQTKKILERFSPIFSDKSKLFIGQNLKFDLSILENYGIKVEGDLFDTMIAHYLLDTYQKHNLDFLASKYLQYKMTPITALIGEAGKNQKNMREVEAKFISDYSCEDVDITLRLKNIFVKMLSENNLEKLFYNIEMPLIKVLMSMERKGVNIDNKNLNDYSITLQKELDELEENIYRLADEKFNINSPLQLGKILFDKLQILSDTKLKKTKTGQYSTGEEELQKYRYKHPIVDSILEYRGINKLLNTYVNVLPNLKNPSTGRIHTSFNQALTSTGRLSSSNPNLQNIPIRDERGREIRKAFVPEDDNHIFYSADYSQIELRIMAHFSNDSNMLEAFNKYSLDIHTATAAKIFNIPASSVTKDMRRQAKTANFGIIYGISAHGLSERLQISRTAAKELIDNYFISFPDVKTYMNNSIEKARENTYVETLFGRRCYLPDINSSNYLVRSYAERTAINAPIQGTAADIIKLAMVNIYKKFQENNLKSKMILQVHDELNFDVLLSEKEIVEKIVAEEMTNVVKLSVPLEIEAKFGNNWLEAH